MEQIWESIETDGTLTPVDKLLLIHVAFRTTEKGCAPSLDVKALASALGVSRNAAASSLKRLIAAKYLRG